MPQLNGMEISPESIKYWSGYAANRKFSTEQEARDWIFRTLENSDRQFGDALGLKGSEHNRQFADQMPIYQSGNSWKIGRPVRNNRNVFRLSDLQIRRPSTEELHNVAQANISGDYEFTDIFWANLRELLPDSEMGSIYSQSGESARIRELAEQIKSNKWVEAVIVGITKDGKWLIEGQHRARALRALGFATVPAIGIVYDESPIIAWVRGNCRLANS